MRGSVHLHGSDAGDTEDVLGGNRQLHANNLSSPLDSVLLRVRRVSCKPANFGLVLSAVGQQCKAQHAIQLGGSTDLAEPWCNGETGRPRHHSSSEPCAAARGTMARVGLSRRPPATIGLDMTDHIPDEVSPAGRDLRAYTDELRPDHPVVRNDRGEWVLLRHDLVRRAALDDVSFSNEVSRFLQVPNGLDGAMHTAFREALDPFLAPAALAPYRAKFDQIAAELVRSLPRGASVEAVREIGAAFAVRAQSAWLGWPAELEGRLLAWIDDNHAATRSGEQGAHRPGGRGVRRHHQVGAGTAALRIQSDRRHGRAAPGPCARARARRRRDRVGAAQLDRRRPRLHRVMRRGAGASPGQPSRAAVPAARGRIGCSSWISSSTRCCGLTTRS